MTDDEAAFFRRRQYVIRRALLALKRVERAKKAKQRDELDRAVRWAAVWGAATGIIPFNVQESAND